MEYKEEIDRLAKEFESCQKILLALGDENRRHLILEMIQMEQCNGVRVGTIYRKTHLSRPAVFQPYTNIERGRNFESPKGKEQKTIIILMRIHKLLIN